MHYLSFFLCGDIFVGHAGRDHNGARTRVATGNLLVLLEIFSNLVCIITKKLKEVIPINLSSPKKTL